MKRVFFLLFIALVSILGILMFGATASEPDPELSIIGCNLSFRDNIYIKYAIKANDFTGVKVLIWTEPQEEYTFGSQNYVLSQTGIEDILETECAIFQYDKLAAKQMTDYVYARAYVEKSGTKYYSQVKKYSILQYVYNKTGKTGTVSSDANLVNMLNGMIEYGSLAQIYFNYRPNRLANSNWYQIKVSGGVLEDYCGEGLYLVGDNVTLYAPEIDEDGHQFAYWINSTTGVVVGTNPVATIEVSNKNELYTAIYETDIVNPDILKFTLQNDNTYRVEAGTDAAGESIITIPATYKDKKVTAISDNGFKNLTNVNSIIIPDSIKTIGSRAFDGCSKLDSVVGADNVITIGDYAFNNTKLSSFIVPESCVTIGERCFPSCSTVTVRPLSLNKIGPYAFQGSLIWDSNETTKWKIGYKWTGSSGNYVYSEADSSASYHHALQNETYYISATISRSNASNTYFSRPNWARIIDCTNVNEIGSYFYSIVFRAGTWRRQ